MMDEAEKRASETTVNAEVVEETPVDPPLTREMILESDCVVCKTPLLGHAAATVQMVKDERDRETGFASDKCLSQQRIAQLELLLDAHRRTIRALVARAGGHVLLWPANFERANEPGPLEAADLPTGAIRLTLARPLIQRAAAIPRNAAGAGKPEGGS